MIEVHNVQKSFDGNQVLRGINCTFETGKCNLLLGGSGTGKSVLLQCIVGLMKPDLGSITFDGTVFTNNKVNIRQEIRRKIGMLFQGSALFDSMTVHENVEFPLKMLTPAQGEQGVLDFIVDTARRAGPNPCPPMILGVGVGGTMEQAALMAKRMTARPLGTRHPDPRYARLEEEALAAINRLGVGPAGVGGRFTALGVHLEWAPTHIAGLPVAVNVCCHAARHAEITL